MGLSKGFLGKFSLDVNVFYRDVNNFADDDQLLNTPVSFPIAFAKAYIYGAEGKIKIPQWGQSGLVSYSYMVGSAYFPVTGGLFLGEDATNALSQMTGRFWVSQDQRNTVRTPLSLPVYASLLGCWGGEYGSGLPFDFNGTYEQALAQYGQQVVDRVNFDEGRVRPSLPVEASAAATLCGRRKSDTMYGCKSKWREPKQPAQRDRLRRAILRKRHRASAQLCSAADDELLGPENATPCRTKPARPKTRKQEPDRGSCFPAESLL